MQKIIVSPINGGAILFTIKVVMNLLLVVREIMGQVSVWCQVGRAPDLLTRFFSFAELLC